MARDLRGEGPLCEQAASSTSEAQGPKAFADYDKWIRHRLRALQLKQWEHGSKIYAEMRRLGMSGAVAAQAAAVNQRWWSCAAKLVQLGLTTRYYDRLGVPRLAD